MVIPEKVEVQSEESAPEDGYGGEEYGSENEK